MLRRKVDSAGEMRADLAVRGVGIDSRAHQDTGALRDRIFEYLDAAYGDFAGTRNRLRRIQWRLVEPRTQENPQVSGEHAEAGQSQKFGQLAAADVALVGGPHGEFVLPERLLTRPAEPRHDLPPTYNLQHRWPPNPGPAGA